MDVGGGDIEAPSSVSIKGTLGLLMANTDLIKDDTKEVISLGIGDPTAYYCFCTTSAAQEAVVDALRSAEFNGYSPTLGLPQTRKALAEYLSHGLPYKLLPEDVYVTAGCTQAIETALSILARPGSNILLPRPGFPIYGLCAAFRNIEVRYFDLVPEKQWEVDLSALERVADNNTAAVVIINPGNPCGNVYTYQHLKEFVERLKNYCDINGGPATFIQVKLNISMLKDISDDFDFCFKLAKEESVIILPGFSVGLKNWVRITFAVHTASLEEALERVKSFCQRHSC